MFGQKPHAIDSRVMSTTHGFDTNHRFDPKLHPMEKKHVVDDVAYCKDCFVVMVKENEMVKIGEMKRFPNYKPLKKSQTSARFEFFTSTDPKVNYTTDDAVGPRQEKLSSNLLISQRALTEILTFASILEARKSK